MTRGLVFVVAMMLCLMGCVRSAQPPEGSAQVREPAGAIELQLAKGERDSATSRGMGAPEPNATFSTDSHEAMGPAAPTACPKLVAQPTTSPTWAPPRRPVAPTPTPIPKPGPDQPFAYVSTYRPEAAVLLDAVPALPQLRNLSCEVAAMRMVLAARGLGASEEEIFARMPRSENPHQGFRGDPEGDGHDPELKDYGVYAEVVAQVLQSYGVPAQAVQGMSDWQLRQAVHSGKAVIVWVTAEKEPRVVERHGYVLVEGEHVYVVVGMLKDGRLLVHDPWGVRADSGRPGTFPVWVIQQWDLFGRQAVVVPLS